MSSTPSADRTVGPYRIGVELGRGASATVFRAAHQSTGRLVALKLADGDDAAVHALRREAAVLEHVHHPGIVAICDRGLDDRPPWYAMPLQEGTPLHVAARAIWDPGTGTTIASRALRDLMSLHAEICAPLAHLHALGIVHRDLNPRNVLARPDGSVQLLDFGLVSATPDETSREVLHRPLGASGTEAFMSPEQWRGEMPDARADLYALGAMLYVALTGRPPYPTLQALLDPRISLRPPSRLVGGVPPALDALLARLLPRDPRRRIGHAEDVADQLAAMGARSPSTPMPRTDRLYRAGLQGRNDVLDRIAASVRRNARSGRGAVMFLTGESGIGKTRLLVELASRLAGSVRVVTGRSLAPLHHGVTRGAAMDPFRGVWRAVADACRSGGGDVSARLLADRGSVLAALDPEIRQLPFMAGRAPAARLDPQASRLRLLSYAADTILALAAEGAPLLLLIDDVQWADELSLHLLELLARRSALEPLPLRIVAAVRDEAMPPLLSALVRRGDAAVEPLARLDARAVRAMLRDSLAREPPPRLAAEISRLSRGNPFFAAEYLRLAVAKGILRRHRGRFRAAGPIHRIEVPRTVHALLRWRLDRIPPLARRLLDVAAVLGREVRGDLWRTAARLPEPVFERELRDLLVRQVVDEPAPDLFRFAHDQVRDGCEAALPAATRRLHHRAAAAAIAALPPARRDEMLAELATHWEASGARSRARACYLTAARHAVAAYAHAEAEQCYRRHLALAEDGAASVAARIELARDVLALSGASAKARLEYRAAIAAARRRTTPRAAAVLALMQAEALRGMAGTLRIGGRMDAAHRCYDRGLGLLARRRSLRTRAAILSDLATLLLEVGRMEESVQAFRQALALHARTGADRERALTLVNFATLHLSQGRPGDAEAAYLEALALARTAGDRPTEGIARGNLASLCHDQGRVAEARDHYAQAIVIHREVGNRRFEAIALGNLANLEALAGSFPRALALVDESIALFRRTGARRNEGMALSIRGNVTRALGDFSTARRTYLDALAIHREVRDRRYEGITLGNLGRLLSEVGDLGAARRFLAQALAVHRNLGNRKSEGFVAHNLGEILQLERRLTDARRWLRLALAIHREVGNRQSEGITLASIGSVGVDGEELPAARAALEEAAAIQRDLGDAANLAITLVELARLARLERRAADGAALLDEADALLAACGSRLGSIAAACERGQLVRSGGGSSRVDLERARALAAELHVSPRSLLGRRIAELGRAARLRHAPKHRGRS